MSIVVINHLPNSRLITGDLPEAVTALAQQAPGSLVAMGSGQLVRSLLPHDRVDEPVLILHPVVLGSGQRLFGNDNAPRRFTRVDSTPTATGMVLLTFRRTTAW